MSESLRVVLIEPEFAGNIGSVARAIGNMGFNDLVMVDPKPALDSGECKAMSVAAYPIVQEARVVSSLTDAIADCHWVVGFTRRSGRHRRAFVPIVELAKKTHEHLAADHKVALVFGPEKRGFTTWESAACQNLVQIPSSEKHPSLNLAAAVMVALYEISRTQIEVETPYPHEDATVDEIEGMYNHLDELYEAVQYFDAQNRHRIPQILRRLFNRARPTSQEVRIIRGLCRNAMNAIPHKK